MNYLSCGLALSVVGIFVGIFMFLQPAAVIKFQIKFYEKINWRIEPISMPKELRNTKFMGLFLVLVCLWSIGYIKLIFR
jgi:hypothetical protein